MQSILALSALFAAAIATAIPSPSSSITALLDTGLVSTSTTLVSADTKRDTSVAARAITHVYMCDAINFGGPCFNYEIQTGLCYNTPGSFNDHLSSLGPDQGTTCTIYSNAGCGGDSRGSIIYPGIFDLRDYGFNDVTSAFRCT